MLKLTHPKNVGRNFCTSQATSLECLVTGNITESFAYDYESYSVTHCPFGLLGIHVDWARSGLRGISKPFVPSLNAQTGCNRAQSALRPDSMQVMSAVVVREIGQATLAILRQDSTALCCQLGSDFAQLAR